MTIKEIESASGLSRANIRYYESEELLEPQRSGNGYRDYSDADLTVLLRIRLLRSLDFSLEDIRALQRGDASLSDALERQLSALEQKEAAARRSRDVCREMRDDGAEFSTLDAGKYLDALSRPGSDCSAAAALPSVPAGDTLPRVTAPWRRFFARRLDTALYSLLWNLILLLCGVPLTNRGGGAGFADGVMLLLMTLLLEPLFLSLTGTTPGKWLLGLSVTNRDGFRLGYFDALIRTGGVLWYGEGLGIPIVNLIRLIKSKKACEDGDELPWENDSVLTLRNHRNWQILAAIGAFAMVSALTVCVYLAAELPKHRGALTVTEFCENFNSYADYFKVDVGGELQPDGTWTFGKTDADVLSSDLMELSPPPVFHFTEENGILTGVSFAAECSGFHQFPGINEASLAVLAFTRAQKGAGLVPQETKSVLTQIESSALTGFSASAYGVEIVWEADSTGYATEIVGNFLWPLDKDGVTHCQMSFTMEKAS